MGSCIPGLWEDVPLSLIADINPNLPIENIPDDLQITFLPMKNVEELSNRIITADTRRYSDVKKGYTPIAEDDVIFAKITPCMENGKVAIAKGLHHGIAFGSTEFFVLRCRRAILNKYLYYYIASKDTRQKAAAHMTGAVGQKRVPRKFLEELSIPLPPLPEQERIVAKIEELFSSLEAGVESLKTAKEQLKVYRQAVLRWAFEGQLFPASEDSKSYRLNQAGQVTGGLTQNINRESNKIKKPFLRVANVQFNAFDLSDVHQIGVQEKEIERALLLKGDLLFVEGNGSIDQLGRVAIWNGSIRDCLHQNHLIKVRFRENIDPKYVLHYFCSLEGRNSIKNQASSTSGLHTLSIRKIGNLSFPYRAMKEQKLIVSFIESRFSACDKLEEATDRGLAQAEALRQSILKKAFEGKLVPQDPNDEPASVLLERIRVEREQAEKEKPIRKRATRPSAGPETQASASTEARRKPGRPRKNKES